MGECRQDRRGTAESLWYFPLLIVVSHLPSPFLQGTLLLSDTGKVSESSTQDSLLLPCSIMGSSISSLVMKTLLFNDFTGRNTY